MKNLVFGTRGFVNQISNQIFLNKELPSNLKEENFENPNLFQFVKKTFDTYDKRDKNIFLKGTVKLRETDDQEKSLFLRTFNIKCENVTFGYRLSISNEIFHSFRYEKKGMTNSYTISYLNRDKKKSYGIIHYFLEYKNKIYCLINSYKFISNPKSILKKSSGLFYNIVFENLFERYYKLIDSSNSEDSFCNFELIEYSQILNRCLLVENELQQSFLCEIPKTFRHD